MDGVTIIQTIPSVVYTPGFNSNILFGLSFLLIGIAFWLLARYLDASPVIPLAFITILFGIYYPITSYFKAVPHYYNKYEVSINESVSMDEFNKYYYILEEKDNTYIVIKRES